jgi:hypothetical protein
VIILVIALAEEFFTPVEHFLLRYCSELDVRQCFGERANGFELIECHGLFSFSACGREKFPSFVLPL